MLFMRIPRHQAITRRALILEMCTRIRIGVQSVEITPMWKDFSALQRNSNVKLVTSLDISLVFVIKRQAPFKSRRLKAHQLQTGTVYVEGRAIGDHSECYSSSDDSFCLQIKVQCPQASLKKIPTPTHLITNLAYRLKPHHTRNQYLRARLDTCTNVNIMPTSVYNLVFKGPELKKFAQQYGDWNLHYRHSQDCGFLQLLFGPPVMIWFDII